MHPAAERLRLIKIGLDSRPLACGVELSGNRARSLLGAA
jgi:hypothetical protein